MHNYHLKNSLGTNTFQILHLKVLQTNLYNTFYIRAFINHSADLILLDNEINFYINLTNFQGDIDNLTGQTRNFNLFTYKGLHLHDYIIFNYLLLKTTLNVNHTFVKSTLFYLLNNQTKANLIGKYKTSPRNSRFYTFRGFRVLKFMGFPHLRKTRAFYTPAILASIFPRQSSLQLQPRVLIKRFNCFKTVLINLLKQQLKLKNAKIFLRVLKFFKFYIKSKSYYSVNRNIQTYSKVRIKKYYKFKRIQLPVYKNRSKYQLYLFLINLKKKYIKRFIKQYILYKKKLKRIYFKKRLKKLYKLYAIKTKTAIIKKQYKNS